MNSKVVAIVVTYNRSEKLATCLTKLREQSVAVDVLIVNNDSTDDTLEVCQPFLEESGWRVITLDSNKGGAGGFAAGMKAAYEAGYEYLWLMDDDTYPDSTACEELLATFDAVKLDHGFELGFVCSNVLWNDRSVCEMNSPGCKWDWHRFFESEKHYINVESTSFVSVLFHRNIVSQFGLPLEEYFIWYDDVEYTKRVSRNYLCLVNLKSKVIHDLPENKGVNFQFVNDDNVWKYEYGARNEASYHFHHGRFEHLISHFRNVRRGLIRGRVKFSLRLRIYKKIIGGLFFNPKPGKVQAPHD